MADKANGPFGIEIGRVSGVNFNKNHTIQKHLMFYTLKEVCEKP